jgi:hypothetical protein
MYAAARIVSPKARIRGAILDHGNVIKAGERIGYDIDSDSARYHVDRSGVVIVPHSGHKAPLLKVASDCRSFGERSSVRENTEGRMMP